ncbi:histidine phosphatase family protein [Camelliibacillus cellulosilyticus]|uniref:Histidine phosphatase family protein n=1 Tax=Camelliibacillus cellulosilyticus TaxID=2174486 RepID=A0ABV9GHZ2_9BACL
MPNIYLIRHAQAEGQAHDAPLTIKGMKGAEALADFLRDSRIQAIYSSPYKRALQTASPLAQKLGLTIEVDERLGERILSSQNMPDWLECLQATFKDLDLAYEGGESSRMAIDRAMRALHDILLTGVEKAAAVTHGNLLSLMLHHIDPSYGFDTWVGLTNPDVFCLSVLDGQFKVQRIWEEKLV